MSLRGDTRGASEVIGYLLSVVLFTIVITGTIVPASTYFEGQDRIAASNQLETTGQEFTGTIQSVDRLVRQSDSPGEIGQQIALPESIRGSGYTVTVINESAAAASGTACDRQCVILDGDEVSQTVYFRSVTPIENTTVNGRTIYVSRPAGESMIRLNATN